MPSYLHPRSRSTSTLFTTTLAVCFLVVALPHALPCPVDNRRFADSANILDENGNPVKRRKRKNVTADDATIMNKIEVAQNSVDGTRRECPVPKPTGMLGSLLGVKAGERQQAIEVVVAPMQEKSRLKRQDNGASDYVP